MAKRKKIQEVETIHSSNKKKSNTDTFQIIDNKNDYVYTETPDMQRARTLIDNIEFQEPEITFRDIVKMDEASTKTNNEEIKDDFSYINDFESTTYEQAYSDSSAMKKFQLFDNYSKAFKYEHLGQNMEEMIDAEFKDLTKYNEFNSYKKCINLIKSTLSKNDKIDYYSVISNNSESLERNLNRMEYVFHTSENDNNANDNELKTFYVKNVYKMCVNEMRAVIESVDNFPNPPLGNSDIYKELKSQYESLKINDIDMIKDLEIESATSLFRNAFKTVNQFKMNLSNLQEGKLDRNKGDKEKAKLDKAPENLIKQIRKNREGYYLNHSKELLEDYKNLAETIDEETANRLTSDILLTYSESKKLNTPIYEFDTMSMRNAKFCDELLSKSKNQSKTLTQIKNTITDENTASRVELLKSKIKANNNYHIPGNYFTSVKVLENYNKLQEGNQNSSVIKLKSLSKSYDYAYSLTNSKNKDVNNIIKKGILTSQIKRLSSFKGAMDVLADDLMTKVDKGEITAQQFTEFRTDTKNFIKEYNNTIYNALSKSMDEYSNISLEQNEKMKNDMSQIKDLLDSDNFEDIGKGLGMTTIKVLSMSKDKYDIFKKDLDENFINVKEPINKLLNNKPLSKEINTFIFGITDCYNLMDTNEKNSQTNREIVKGINAFTKYEDFGKVNNRIANFFDDNYIEERGLVPYTKQPFNDNESNVQSKGKPNIEPTKMLPYNEDKKAEEMDIIQKYEPAKHNMRDPKVLAAAKDTINDIKSGYQKTDKKDPNANDTKIFLYTLGALYCAFLLLVAPLAWPAAAALICVGGYMSAKVFSHLKGRWQDANDYNKVRRIFKPRKHKFFGAIRDFVNKIKFGYNPNYYLNKMNKKIDKLSRKQKAQQKDYDLNEQSRILDYRRQYNDMTMEQIEAERLKQQKEISDFVEAKKREQQAAAEKEKAANTKATEKVKNSDTKATEEVKEGGNKENNEAEKDSKEETVTKEEKPSSDSNVDNSVKVEEQKTDNETKKDDLLEEETKKEQENNESEVVIEPEEKEKVKEKEGKPVTIELGPQDFTIKKESDFTRKM